MRTSFESVEKGSSKKAVLKQTSSLAHRESERFSRKEHGGNLRAGRRKEMRPLDPKRPVHVVLRSERAKGSWSLLKPSTEIRIKGIVYSLARRFQVQVKQYANSGNHLHLLVVTQTREGFQRFLKAIAGLIARLVTGARKGNPQGQFWDALAYTRVVEWGRDFFNSKYYVIQNELEALGIWTRKWKASARGSRKLWLTKARAAPPPGKQALGRNSEKITSFA